MPSTRDFHVLLVEDEEIDAELIVDAFHRWSDDNLGRVQAHRVRDGEECMDYLRAPGNKRPDVIFLDLKMPKKTGRDVLAELRVDPELEIIPVVILSGSNEDSDRKTAYRLGANSFVSKPVRRPEYEKVMEAVIQYWSDVNNPPPL